MPLPNILLYLPHVDLLTCVVLHYPKGRLPCSYMLSINRLGYLSIGFLMGTAGPRACATSQAACTQARGRQAGGRGEQLQGFQRQGALPARLGACITHAAPMQRMPPGKPRTPEFPCVLAAGICLSLGCCAYLFLLGVWHLGCYAG